uniref:Uncharacterized protein n=1 Tax=Kalanchoe fedtschenkoi TaxID=63787 RepID=A0A7N0TWX5_KALFE
MPLCLASEILIHFLNCYFPSLVSVGNIFDSVFRTVAGPRLKFLVKSSSSLGTFVAVCDVCYLLCSICLMKPDDWFSRTEI